jgi:putative membrane protein
MADRGLMDGDEARDRGPLVIIGLSSLAVVAGVGLLLVGRGPQSPAVGDVSALPAVNAFLNGTSAVLLATGFAFIRRGRVAAHRACMLSAFGVSTLFLLSYVVYHALAGSVPFSGRGAIRGVYFTLLLSHIVLAAVVVPLALTTIWRALGERFDHHRRIARWTLPIWLYVSVTGVVIYWMLYHLYRPS